MKRLIRVLTILVIIIIAVVFGLQLFLNRGLKPVVQKALPKVSEAVGLEIAIGDVAINLFGGSLSVDQLEIRNPEGFKEPNVFALAHTVLDVGLRSLTKGILEISEATVKDAKLTLVRNDAGDVNLTKIQDELPKAAPTADTPPPAPSDVPEVPAPAPDEEDFEMPKVQLDQLAFNALFEFVDYKTTNPAPNRLSFDLKLAATDIATFGMRPESEWGTVAISGGLRDKPEAFVTDIKARVAPITDPLLASFSAEGNIMAIDMRELGAMADEIGVASKSADLTLRLNVRDGVFLPGSELVATLRDAELVGDLRKKHGKVNLPPDISLTIPVPGTLASPDISFQQAITVSIIRNLTQNPDYILDNVTVDGKSLRERLGKALGGDGDDDGDGGKADGDGELEETINEGLKKLGDLFR